jgi:aminoglycoside phosphotransferase (APT) family kinase protein
MGTTRTAESLKKIAEGREAEMFAWEDGRVLRLYRSGVTVQQVEGSVRTLQSAREAGVRVPAVYGLETVDGRPGVVMERLEGMDLLTALGRQPWRLFSIGAVCGRVHAALNATPAPPGLESTHDRLARFILRPEHVPPQFAELAITRLRELPRGDRLSHGDYHPGNVMMQDGEPVVIDWSNATSGPPEADFARTTMLLAMGEPPPGTPTLVRLLSSGGRRLFGALYAREYRRHIRVDEDLVKAWRLPIAVARLTDGIEEEREKLHRVIGELSRSA